jgi:ubiquitin-conjugating enzyme E2 J2
MSETPTTLCLKRITSEMNHILKNQDPQINIQFDEKNILHVYFVFYNLQDTVYSGYYFGEMTFPYDYPLRAPKIVMNTPSGRFEIGKFICTSFSHFHDSKYAQSSDKPAWSPAFNISSCCKGLLSLLFEESEGIGSILLTDINKEELINKRISFAKNSLDYNIAHYPEFIYYFEQLYKTNEVIKQVINVKEPIPEVIKQDTILEINNQDVNVKEQIPEDKLLKNIKFLKNKKNNQTITDEENIKYSKLIKYYKKYYKK